MWRARRRLALLLLLLGRHEGVVHDALGQAVQPLADVVREVDLVLGRGDVLVVGQVAEHVAGEGTEVVHTGLELALLPRHVRPVRAGQVPLVVHRHKVPAAPPDQGGGS